MQCDATSENVLRKARGRCPALAVDRRTHLQGQPHALVTGHQIQRALQGPLGNFHVPPVVPLRTPLAVQRLMR